MTGPAFRRSLLGVFLLAVLCVTACTPAPTSGGVSEPAVALPDTAVGTQAIWVLSVLNAPEPVAQARVTQHLAEIMFEELDADDFVDVFEQFRADQPWTVTEVDESGDQAVLRIVGANDTAVKMSISLDGNGEINGLYFAPAPAERTPGADY